MSPTTLPARKVLVVPPPDVAGMLASLSALDSLSASGRLVVTLVDTEPAALLYATLLHLRMRDRPAEDVSEPLCVHRDAGFDFERLRALGVHEALVTSGRAADARIATAAGIGVRVGFKTWPASMFLRTAIPRPEGSWIGEEAKPLVDALDVPWQQRTQLEITKGWREVGTERLTKAKIEVRPKTERGDDERIVGLYAGAARSPAEGKKGGKGKTWPAERWLELLRLLRQRRPAWRFVLVSDEAGLWESVKLHEKTGRIHPVIGPDLDIGGNAAVLHQLDVLVGRGDTWPVHVAAAVGTRVVALFDGGDEDAARRMLPPDDAERGEGHRVSVTRFARLRAEQVADLCGASNAD